MRNNEKTIEIEKKRKKEYQAKINRLKSRQSFINTFYSWASGFLLIMILLALIAVASKHNVLSNAYALLESQSENPQSISAEDMPSMMQKGQ
ncbi:MAG: hypothetical protein K6B67_05545 [Lachnospiraceae bacterium]|nr:hypothetical protein [Lachnospiraceae bacterium]